MASTPLGAKQAVRLFRLCQRWVSRIQIIGSLGNVFALRCLTFRQIFAVICQCILKDDKLL